MKIIAKVFKCDDVVSMSPSQVTALWHQRRIASCTTYWKCVFTWVSLKVCFHLGFTERVFLLGVSLCNGFLLTYVNTKHLSACQPVMHVHVYSLDQHFKPKIQQLLFYAILNYVLSYCAQNCVEYIKNEIHIICNFLLQSDQQLIWNELPTVSCVNE